VPRGAIAVTSSLTACPEVFQLYGKVLGLAGLDAMFLRL
jgi:hypothetical protein